MHGHSRTRWSFVALFLLLLAALWAARGIHPLHRYRQSQATYQREAAKAGYRLTCHVWKTLAELNPEERAAVETDMRGILSQTEQ